MCAGCYGDQLDSPPDAGARDDDQRELVTLQFYADAVDLAGFPVYFQNADSSLVIATHTDGEGRASALMHPGGFVTLALKAGRMYTYANVRGGDVLVVNEADNNTDRKQIQVMVPPSPGANRYTMWTSCGATQLDDELIRQGMPQQAMLIGCGARSDVAITANWVEQGFSTNYRYLYAKDVALDPTMLTTFPGEFVPQVDSEVVATAMREPAEHVKLTQQLVRDRHELTPERTITVDVVGDTATGWISRVVAPPEGMMMTRIAPLALGISAQTTLVWGPADTAMEVALGNHALRSYTTRPRLAEDNTVQWTEEPDGAVGDLVLLELSWSPPQAQSRIWKILSPRTDATVVRYPVLPVPEMRPLEDAWVTELATLAIDDVSVARTTLLGSWPLDDAWLADSDAGRADYRRLVPPIRN